MHPSAAITTRTTRSRFGLFELALVLALAGSCAGGSEAPDQGSDPGGDPGGETARELSVCYFGESAIHCGPADDDARVRVDDFYPSACLDGDHDRDRVPDFMDMDDPGGDVDDDHRCRSCNRGPGQQGDFRFEVRGDQARLDRGMVHVYDHDLDSLIVPTPHGGSLTIMISSDTRIDDGYPAPGAEIRAEGEIDEDGVLWADRLEVLCTAPEAVSPEDVPPECEAVDPRQD
jgi:hypothetical protein